MKLREYVMSFLGWLKAGNSSDVVISSRLRLARNLANHRFPNRASIREKEAIAETLQRAFKPISTLKNAFVFDFPSLTDIDREMLFEKHLISRDFMAGPDEGKKIALSPDGSVAIMVNEEDHIRLQVFSGGLSLREVFERGMELDTEISKRVEIAFDQEFGYLTSCPTNVGTGMRLSVMVHLPALTITGKVSWIADSIRKIGHTVRGLYGEGTEAIGAIYQVSNQVTLGRSEEELLSLVEKTVKKIIDYERAERRSLMSSRKRAWLEDKVWRAYGTLRYARLIPSREAIERLSEVKLGVDLGILNVSLERLLLLWVITRPAHLQERAGKPLRPEERDILRATVIREVMGK